MSVWYDRWASSRTFRLSFGALDQLLSRFASSATLLVYVLVIDGFPIRAL